MVKQPLFYNNDLVYHPNFKQPIKKLVVLEFQAYKDTIETLIWFPGPTWLWVSFFETHPFRSHCFANETFWETPRHGPPPWDWELQNGLVLSWVNRFINFNPLSPSGMVVKLPCNKHWWSYGKFLGERKRQNSEQHVLFFKKYPERALLVFVGV